ncbi:MAG: S8 family serine peptidase, partial [Tissierellaceae bacterium]
VNIRSLSNIDLDGYSSLSGTSMATPLVSGAIALLLNEYGPLETQEIKKRIIESCIDLKDRRENQGAGLLNLRLLFSNGTGDRAGDLEDDKEIDLKIRDKSLLENLILLLAILILFDSKK